ncbi:MAG: hypothetical protein M1819_005621 [Sarea resinae]|nr:MAG: hypothetical protein M1819_005621 [Sarea resinae]
MAPTLPSPVAASLILLTPAQKIKNTVPSLLRRSTQSIRHATSLLQRSTPTDSAKSAQTSSDGPFSSSSSSHMPSHSFAVILIPVFVVVLLLMTAGYFLYRRRERIRATNARRAAQLQASTATTSSSPRGGPTKNMTSTTHKGWYATPPDGNGNTTTVTADRTAKASEKQGEKLPALPPPMPMPPPYEATHQPEPRRAEVHDEFEARGMELGVGERKSTFKGLKHQSRGFTML